MRFSTYCALLALAYLTWNIVPAFWQAFMDEYRKERNG